MKCNKCGVENKKENKFCVGCGSKLNLTEKKKVKKETKSNKILIIFISIIIVILVVIIAGLAYFSSMQDDYKKYEKDVKKVSVSYANTYLLDYTKENYITLKDLKKYDSKINKNNYCKGYVAIEKEDYVGKTYVYISCPGYKTKNYNKKYEEKSNLAKVNKKINFYNKDLIYTYANNDSEKEYYDSLDSYKKIYTYECKTSNKQKCSAAETSDGHQFIVYDNGTAHLVNLYNKKNTLMNVKLKSSDKLTYLYESIDKGIAGIIINNSKVYLLSSNKVVANLKKGNFEIKYSYKKAYVQIHYGKYIRYNDKVLNLEDGKVYNSDLIKEEEKKIQAKRDEIASKVSESNVIGVYEASKVVRTYTDENGTSQKIELAATIKLYKDNYMTITSGDGMDQYENTAGTYKLENNKLTYNRAYTLVGGTPEYYEEKDYNNKELKYVEFNYSNDKINCKKYTSPFGDPVENLEFKKVK